MADVPEQAGSATINIKVKTMEPATYSVQIASQATVAELKGQLVSIANIPQDRQRLIYRGRVLSDEQTLSALGIADEHTLHLVQRAADAGQQAPQQQGQQPAQGAPRAGGGQQPVPEPQGMADFARTIMQQALGQLGGTGMAIGPIQVNGFNGFDEVAAGAAANRGGIPTGLAQIWEGLRPPLDAGRPMPPGVLRPPNDAGRPMPPGDLRRNMRGRPTAHHQLSALSNYLDRLEANHGGVGLLPRLAFDMQPGDNDQQLMRLTDATERIMGQAALTPGLRAAMEEALADLYRGPRRSVSVAAEAARQAPAAQLDPSLYPNPPPGTGLSARQRSGVLLAVGALGTLTRRVTRHMGRVASSLEQNSDLMLEALTWRPEMPAPNRATLQDTLRARAIDTWRLGALLLEMSQALTVLQVAVQHNNPRILAGSAATFLSHDGSAANIPYPGDDEEGFYDLPQERWAPPRGGAPPGRGAGMGGGTGPANERDLVDIEVAVSRERRRRARAAAGGIPPRRSTSASPPRREGAETDQPGSPALPGWLEERGVGREGLEARMARHIERGRTYVAEQMANDRARREMARALPPRRSTSSSPPRREAQPDEPGAIPAPPPRRAASPPPAAAPQGQQQVLAVEMGLGNRYGAPVLLERERDPSPETLRRRRENLGGTGRLAEYTERLLGLPAYRIVGRGPEPQQPPLPDPTPTIRRPMDRWDRRDDVREFDPWRADRDGERPGRVVLRNPRPGRGTNPDMAEAYGRGYGYHYDISVEDGPPFGGVEVRGAPPGGGRRAPLRPAPVADSAMDAGAARNQPPARQPPPQPPQAPSPSPAAAPPQPQGPPPPPPLAANPAITISLGNGQQHRFVLSELVSGVMGAVGVPPGGPQQQPQQQQQRQAGDAGAAANAGGGGGGGGGLDMSELANMLAPLIQRMMPAMEQALDQLEAQQQGTAPTAAAPGGDTAAPAAATPAAQPGAPAQGQPAAAGPGNPPFDLCAVLGNVLQAALVGHPGTNQQQQQGGGDAQQAQNPMRQTQAGPFPINLPQGINIDFRTILAGGGGPMGPVDPRQAGNDAQVLAPGIEIDFEALVTGMLGGPPPPGLTAQAAAGLTTQTGNAQQRDGTPAGQREASGPGEAPWQANRTATAQAAPANPSESQAPAPTPAAAVPPPAEPPASAAATPSPAPPAGPTSAPTPSHPEPSPAPTPAPTASSAASGSGSSPSPRGMGGGLMALPSRPKPKKAKPEAQASSSAQAVPAGDGMRQAQEALLAAVGAAPADAPAPAAPAAGATPGTQTSQVSRAGAAAGPPVQPDQLMGALSSMLGGQAGQAGGAGGGLAGLMGQMMNSPAIQQLASSPELERMANQMFGGAGGGARGQGAGGGPEGNLDFGGLLNQMMPMMGQLLGGGAGAAGPGGGGRRPRSRVFDGEVEGDEGRDSALDELPPEEAERWRSIIREDRVRQAEMPVGRPLSAAYLAGSAQGGNNAGASASDAAPGEDPEEEFHEAADA